MLFTEIEHTLEQLAGSLERIANEDYCQPVERIFGASTGQHVRHVIELFQCAQQGYETGVVNYEHRKRDVHIETNRQLAVSLLRSLAPALHTTNKTLTLEAAYNDTTGPATALTTNYFREIAYNLEHTIHHMALIRIALHEVCALRVEPSYGVAPATIQYRSKCAQ
jgi:hypothetical protein